MNLNSQRVAILIDEVNIYRTAKNIYGNGKMNIQAIMDCLNDRQIIRAVVYCVDTPENNVAKYANCVKKYGVEVKSKPVKIFHNGCRKGDWDVGMTIDAVQLAQKVDVITLITADGDFKDLVHYLKSKGVKVELMAFPQQVSHELLQSVDEFNPITEDMLLKK